MEGEEKLRALDNYMSGGDWDWTGLGRGRGCDYWPVT